MSGFLFDSYLIMDIIIITDTILFKFYIETCFVSYIFMNQKQKSHFAACCVNRAKEQLQR